ncbi:hypothetical protein LR48_Vigan407s000100 [Vigna angularis]|uniref:Uncharacterized protein n=1 Tax=Phaseolus angularis TaxID=3914 RepID=A0A0L9TA92_PHAAN|nr:hypothetical protein LR48_Vigan407s000100 [Vigna angularis]
MLDLMNLPPAFASLPESGRDTPNLRVHLPPKPSCWTLLDCAGRTLPPSSWASLDSAPFPQAADALLPTWLLRAPLKFQKNESPIHVLENGVIEIEAPYSMRVKKVDRKQLMSWCDERKRNTNSEDRT